MGALDVCPFIPVSNVTVEECVEARNVNIKSRNDRRVFHVIHLQVSKAFGRRLAEELSVPVFLYGFAAEKGEYRKTMPQVILWLNQSANKGISTSALHITGKAKNINDEKRLNIYNKLQLVDY